MVEILTVNCSNFKDPQFKKKQKFASGFLLYYQKIKPTHRIQLIVKLGTKHAIVKIKDARKKILITDIIKVRDPKLEFDAILIERMKMVKKTHENIFNELFYKFPFKKNLFDTVKIEWGKRCRRFLGMYYPIENRIHISKPYETPNARQLKELDTKICNTIYHELLHVFFHGHKSDFHYYENRYHKHETEEAMKKLKTKIRFLRFL